MNDFFSTQHAIVAHTTLLKMFVYVSSEYIDLDEAEKQGFKSFFHALECGLKKSAVSSASTRFCIPALIALGSQLVYEKSADARLVAGKEMEAITAEFASIAKHLHEAQVSHWGDDYFSDAPMMTGPIDSEQLSHDIYNMLLHFWRSLDVEDKRGFAKGYKIFEACMSQINPPEKEILIFIMIIAHKFGSLDIPPVNDDSTRDSFVAALSESNIILSRKAPPKFPKMLTEILDLTAPISRSTMKILLRKYGVLKDHKKDYIEFTIQHPLFQSIYCYYLEMGGEGESIYFVQVPHTNTTVDLSHYKAMVFGIKHIPDTLDEVIKMAVIKKEE